MWPEPRFVAYRPSNTVCRAKVGHPFLNDLCAHNPRFSPLCMQRAFSRLSSLHARSALTRQPCRARHGSVRPPRFRAVSGGEAVGVTSVRIGHKYCDINVIRLLLSPAGRGNRCCKSASDTGFPGKARELTELQRLGLRERRRSDAGFQPRKRRRCAERSGIASRATRRNRRSRATSIRAPRASRALSTTDQCADEKTAGRGRPFRRFGCRWPLASYPHSTAV